MVQFLGRVTAARYNQRLFYKHRDRFNSLIEDGRTNTAEAAELFYYLNRTCFNGLCRFNQNGKFNVPFGQYRKVRYTKHFGEYRTLFRHWSFTSRDLEKIRIRPDDFIYADPPYDVLYDGGFTTYTANGFSWKDQIRTAEFLARHDGPVLLSNLATPRITGLYRGLGFRLQFLNAPRRISCDGNRQSAREVLASRNL
jgi:DNA adenine methylase